MVIRMKALVPVALLSVCWLTQAPAARAELIGLYTFNGNANDSSGNGNNGTVNGTVTYTNNGPFGGSALTLDGTSRSNYVNVPIDSTVAGTTHRDFRRLVLCSGWREHDHERGAYFERQR